MYTFIKGCAGVWLPNKILIRIHTIKFFEWMCVVENYNVTTNILSCIQQYQHRIISDSILINKAPLKPPSESRDTALMM